MKLNKGFETWSLEDIRELDKLHPHAFGAKNLHYNVLMKLRVCKNTSLSDELNGKVIDPHLSLVEGRKQRSTSVDNIILL
jgi:hypothetical protein